MSMKLDGVVEQTTHLENDMKKVNKGHILNVASIAGFMPGPLMATYYSTKAYVLRLTTSIYEELRRDKSNVVVSCLCPGPVDTNFNEVAGVKFSIKPLSSKYVSEYAIKQMFKKKLIVILEELDAKQIDLSKAV